MSPWTQEEVTGSSEGLPKIVYERPRRETDCGRALTEVLRWRTPIGALRYGLNFNWDLCQPGLLYSFSMALVDLGGRNKGWTVIVCTITDRDKWMIATAVLEREWPIWGDQRLRHSHREKIKSNSWQSQQSNGRKTKLGDYEDRRLQRMISTNNALEPRSPVMTSIDDSLGPQ